MEAIIDKIIGLYGPLAAGWIVAIFLWRALVEERKAHMATQALRIDDQKEWGKEKTAILDKGFETTTAMRIVLEGLKDRLGRSPA